MATPWMVRCTEFGSPHVTVFLDVDEPAALRLEVEADRPQVWEGGANLGMAFFGSIEQQKPAPAGSEHLTADRPVTAGAVVLFIEHLIADAACQPALGFPVRVQDLSKGFEIAP